MAKPYAGIGSFPDVFVPGFFLTFSDPNSLQLCFALPLLGPLPPLTNPMPDTTGVHPTYQILTSTLDWHDFFFEKMPRLTLENGPGFEDAI